MRTNKIHILKAAKIICFFCLALTTYRCETIVEVDLPEHKPVLVANSLFNPEEAWRIQIYHSVPSLSNQTDDIVYNASVEVSDEEGNVIPFNYSVSGGYYYPRNNSKPEVGKEYTLKVSALRYEPIEASDYVPKSVPIEKVDVDVSSTPYKFTVHFTDPADQKNYYEIMVLTPESGVSSRLLPVWFESDDLIFQELGGIDTYEALFDDSLISGQSYSLKLHAHPFEMGRQMYVMLLSLTESHYKYMRSVESQQDNGDNPFSTPVQVYNNIKGGLGIFAGYSFSRVPVF